MIFMHSLLFIELKWHKDCDVNYDVKHSFITTLYSMKQSFVSRTKALFWGARTSMCKISFQILFDAKFSKCSNEQNTKTSNIRFWNKLMDQKEHPRTSNIVLERALGSSSSILLRCYVFCLVYALVHVLSLWICPTCSKYSTILPHLEALGLTFSFSKTDLKITFYASKLMSRRIELTLSTTHLTNDRVIMISMRIWII